MRTLRDGLTGVGASEPLRGQVRLRTAQQVIGEVR